MATTLWTRNPGYGRKFLSDRFFVFPDKYFFARKPMLNPYLYTTALTSYDRNDRVTVPTMCPLFVFHFITSVSFLSLGPDHSGRARTNTSLTLTSFSLLSNHRRNTTHEVGRQSRYSNVRGSCYYISPRSSPVSHLRIGILASSINPSR